MANSVIRETQSCYRGRLFLLEGLFHEHLGWGWRCCILCCLNVWQMGLLSQFFSFFFSSSSWKWSNQVLNRCHMGCWHHRLWHTHHATALAPQTWFSNGWLGSRCFLWVQRQTTSVVSHHTWKLMESRLRFPFFWFSIRLTSPSVFTFKVTGAGRMRLDACGRLHSSVSWLRPSLFNFSGEQACTYSKGKGTAGVTGPGTLCSQVDLASVTRRLTGGHSNKGKLFFHADYLRSLGFSCLIQYE